jgi:hypothetical protein
MDSIRRENEKVPAIGNMKVNSKGDQIKGGRVTKTADQIARENHRVQSTVVNTGLKGPVPAAPTAVLEAPKAPRVAKTTKATKEVELPSGDIIMKEDDEN